MSRRVSLSVSLSLMTTGVVLLLWRNAYFKPGGSGFSSVRGDHGVSSSLSLLFVGVYRQACSRIPLAIGFVGRDRLLWNSIVQGTQRFRQVRAASCVIPNVLCGGLYCLRCRCLWRGYLSALIYPGGQGYMETPSRVQLESYYNTIG